MRTVRFAFFVFGIAVAMSAATTPPYDYFVSLYQAPGTTQVAVNLGNNAFTGAAPAGPAYNSYVRVSNAAGQVCVAEDGQAPPIPTGKAWGAYLFKVTYPKIVGRPLNKGTTTYTITAAINPEHFDADRNHSNNMVTQTFTFPAGGTASCTPLPRPTFH